MKLNDLKPKTGSTKKKLIVGRGIGSGKGKTCGSGHKGQKARSGVAIKGFEGGQMPLYKRLPKMGFSNVKFATRLVTLSLDDLQAAVDAKVLDAKKPVDEDALVAAGLISRKRDGVKLLGNGSLSAKLDLKLTKASASAKAAVEKAGGSVDFIEKVVAPVKNGKTAKSKS